MWEQEKFQFYNMESNVVVVKGVHSGVWQSAFET